MGEYDIVPLPREEWRGQVIPMRYTTSEYFDVEVKESESGMTVELVRKRFETPVTHTPEEYDFPDRLFQEHWEGAYAWGVLRGADGGRQMIACIETAPELWSNRLRVTELWVHEDFRRRGIAHELMAVAKEQARLERRRAIILETQSCNAGAICFYRKEGFRLIGFDACCYSNADLERKEVRLELGVLREKKTMITAADVDIRRERELDYRMADEMAMRAFWNKHRPGCDEHYLLHVLRSSPDYLPELSRVAVRDGKVIGGIYYSRAQLRKEGETRDIVTFGPLCVAPEWQGRGVGTLLLRETIPLASEAGYDGIVIFGDPDYYPRHGFLTCDHFGIATADGENRDSFMGYELRSGALAEFGGRFYESEVFQQLPDEEVQAYSGTFPPMKKQRFPMQWK